VLLSCPKFFYLNTEIYSINDLCSSEKLPSCSIGRCYVCVSAIYNIQYAVHVCDHSYSKISDVSALYVFSDHVIVWDVPIV